MEEEYKIDIQVLEQLLLDHLENSPAAQGITRQLIAENGSLKNLTPKQLEVFNRDIWPKLAPPCEGLYGEGTCIGDGTVDEPSLLQSYREGEMLCQHCRLARDRHDSE